MSKAKIYIEKFIVLILALQILNLSIDQQSFHPEQPRFTLCYINEMNSVVELITEKLITKRDTFPEDKNQNTSSPQVHKSSQISIFFPSEKINTVPKLFISSTYGVYLPLKYNSVYSSIQSPPPKYC